jgi:hypothetical protein
MQVSRFDFRRAFAGVCFLEVAVSTNCFWGFEFCLQTQIVATSRKIVSIDLFTSQSLIGTGFVLVIGFFVHVSGLKRVPLRIL